VRVRLEQVLDLGRERHDARRISRVARLRRPEHRAALPRDREHGAVVAGRLDVVDAVLERAFQLEVRAGHEIDGKTRWFRVDARANGLDPRAGGVDQRAGPERGALHQVLREHLATFLVRSNEQDGPGLPRFVTRELERALTCGVLTYGFARLRCTQCGQDELVAFSCKGRGFCPSCGGRRMADTAAHLVDEVLPEVRVRQWVLSFPYRIRFLLAFDPALCSAVRGIFVRTILGWLRERGAAAGTPRGSSGAVVLAQRFGGALNLNRKRPDLHPRRRLTPCRAVFARS